MSFSFVLIKYETKEVVKVRVEFDGDCSELQARCLHYAVIVIPKGKLYRASRKQNIHYMSVEHL